MSTEANITNNDNTINEEPLRITLVTKEAFSSREQFLEMRENEIEETESK